MSPFRSESGKSAAASSESTEGIVLYHYPHFTKGLSKISIAFFSATEICGTPGYLAPEILECSMDPDHKGYGKEVDM